MPRTMDGQPRYSIRLHPARSAAAIGIFAAIAAALAVSGCGRQGEAPRFRPEDVRVELGIAGVHDPSRWNQLRVIASNSGADFRGSLEICGIVLDAIEKRRDPVSYRIDLEISSSTTREIAIPVRPEGWVEIALEFRQPGWSSGLRVPAQLSGQEGFRILVLAQERSDFTALQRWIEENFLPGAAMPGGAPGNLTPGCRLAYAAIEDLPRRPVAYAPFQLVLIHGTSLAAASPEALGALAGWVEGGGTLVAAPGPSWTGGLPRPLGELLGVRLADPASGEAPGISRELLIYGERGGLYERLVPAAGARLTHRGLAIENRPGAGSAITLRFAPASRRASTGGSAGFPAPGEAPELYSILGGPAARAVSFGGNSGAALGELERGISQPLFTVAGFRVPSRTAVALGLTVYILAGFLAPALVLGRLRRREWTFAVVIAAAGLATLGIYRYGLLSAMQSVELEEVTVLRLHGGGAAAEATSFLGAISPHLERLRLAAQEGSPRGEALSGALPQPLRGFFPGRSYRFREENLPVPATAFEADLAGGLRLPEVTLHPNGMRFFRIDYRGAVEDFLEVDRGPGGAPDLTRVRLRNLQPAPVLLYLVSGARYGYLKTLSPGEAGEIECGPGPMRAGNPVSSLDDGQMQGAFFTSGSRRNASPGTWPSDPNLSSALKRTLQVVAAPWRRDSSVNIFQNQQPDAGMPKFMNARDRPPPAYLIAAVASPFFPAADEFERRNAITLLVIELAPGATQ